VPELTYHPVPDIAWVAERRRDHRPRL